MRTVAGEYEALRVRQRAAMAQQMALDAASLAKLDAQKALEPAVRGRPAGAARVGLATRASPQLRLVPPRCAVSAC